MDLELVMVNSREKLNDLKVIFWAPYSESLWLRKAGEFSTEAKRKSCIKRNFHNLYNTGLSCGCMSWEIYYCPDCDTYFDEAFFNGPDENGKGHNTGYDGTTRFIYRYGNP